MFGLLLMLGISVLIGWLISLAIGTWGGIVVGIAVFFLWFRFNQQQGTTGLYKANLSSYFSFRRRGQTVDEALQSMIKTRYRLINKQMLETALSIPSEIEDSKPDEIKVTETVFSIFCMENGPPPNPQPYRSAIQKIYLKMSKINGLS